MTIDVTPIRAEHIEGFHAALDSVAREQRYLAMTEAPPLEATRAFVERCMAGGVAQYVAVADGAVIGACDIVPFERPTQRHGGGLGMWLLPPFRGLGLGQRLIVPTLLHAKKSGLTRVELGVYDDNVRAASLYERVGFEREGMKRNATRIAGSYKNLVIMAIAQLDRWDVPKAAM